MTRPARRRPGFTLLEVLLASLIALLLLAALYAAMDVTLTQTDVSREQVAANNLSRAVLNRMSSDLAHSLGPLPPQSGATPAPADASGGSMPMAATGGQTATAGTGATTGGAAASPDGTDPTADPTTAAASTLLPFQGGVFGTDKQLTVFVSRVPLTLTDADAAASAANPDAQHPADLRRVVYYLAPDGTGLCRQDRPWVTADGVGNSTDPDQTDPAADLIAPEVKDVTFEYLDATGSWTTEWDGSLPGSDGMTPTGPPRAVRATLTLEVAPGKHGGPTEKRVQHVFLLRAAVGMYVPPTDATTDTTGTTGGGMP